MTKNVRTQLNKVIGKSLNGYHAKVKPKLDELKFKEQYQGRIIDCMVGEVDDNYIETPSTDNPIVKLEHSKEGVVKVPTIKGKTILVDAEGNETDTPAEGCRLVSVGENEGNKIKLLLKSPLLKGDKLVVKDNELYHYHKWNRLTVDENAQIKEVSHGSTVEGCKKWMVTCKCLIEHPLDETYNNNNNFISNYKENKVGWHIKDTLFIENDKICCILPNNISETEVKNYIKNNMMAIYRLSEPYYEEVLNEYGEPIILEGYENGTIYIDSTIVPTTTLRYTPKMESIRTLKAVSHSNNMVSDDINTNIVDYMMNVDLMITEKEMALGSHSRKKNIKKIGVKSMTNMQKRTKEMLERLFRGKTLTKEECQTRVTIYLNAGKITDEQAEELMLLIEEIYA